MKTFSIVNGDLSDGSHTFDELYEHRFGLYIALCKFLATDDGFERYVWRSLQHSDGPSYEGWFLLGIEKGAGVQITYHLPLSKWDECAFADTLERAPEWDGHTSADVLERIKRL